MDLSQTKISDLTLLLDTILSTNSHLEHLQHLDLRRNQISRKDLDVSHAHFAKLRVMNSMGQPQNPLSCAMNIPRGPSSKSISAHHSIERCQLYSRVTIRAAPKDILVELGRVSNTNRGNSRPTTDARRMERADLFSACMRRSISDDSIEGVG